MSLGDLNKELYNPNSDAGEKTHKKSRFDPELSPQNDSQEFQKKEMWIKGKKGLTPDQKKIIKRGLWAVGSIVLLGLLTLAVYEIRRSAFNEEKTTIGLEGPTVIDSTQPAQYIIRYKNGNRVDLKDAVIRLNYQENFQPEEAANLKTINASNSQIYIGTIKAHFEGTIELKGKFYAPQDYIVYLRATLSYTPSNFNSTFEAQNQLGVSVQTSPIFLEIAAPLEAASGNRVEYVIDYKNLGTRNFSDVRIKAEYPEGFLFSSAEPQLSEGNNFWYIGKLDPQQGGKIKIQGTLQGARSEEKKINVFAGSLSSSGQFLIYTQSDKTTKIIVSPLSITQSVNNQRSPSVNVGEELYYVLKYQNEGEIGLRDVIITLEIKSLALNFSKLKLGNGFYDRTHQTITWKAPDFPQLTNLGPGEGGEIRFSVPVTSQIPVDNENDKNFTVTSTAKIDSPDIPTPLGSNKIIDSDTLEFKLNSKVILETLGYYADPNIPNSGPVPPQVGKETTYTIHWKITNVNNDIADTRVVSSLSTGVKWTGKIYPESENIAFNERTNQIIWEVGKLKNGIGILNPKREISFQVSIIPQINQAGQEALLLTPSILTAKDLFTGEELRAETPKKNTLLPEDVSIGGNYKVENPGNEPG
ncbi:MAG: hypothetical protein NT136_01020 [Candidatus Moranbacteria bacterium]|nr:hypothetical protein [Candidatus Moranbacteria bacterium]